MARRKNQLFSLSFLDLLTSALGAIIFLFIITPKGGESAAAVRQAVVYFDTTQMKIFGDLHDSLMYKQVGDTLFTVLVDYKELPMPKDDPKPVLAFNDRPTRKEPVKKPEPKVEEPKKKETPKTPEKTKKEDPKPPVPKTQPTTDKKVPRYKGDAPSVPSVVSFEINWANKEDNVDLFVCKGSSCVYGRKKRDRKIGEWDSGKSRNRLFGNDLRTNMEAVRQFDEIVQGQYKLYAQFKDSKSDKASVPISGLIYTKGPDNVERGESFSATIQKGADRVLLGSVILLEDGRYQFKR